MKSPKCLICNGNTFALDVVDFNKSCAEPGGVHVPLSGKPVYYFMCDACSHTFAPEFLEWTPQDFLDRIYNDVYVVFDPDYKEARPAANAKLLVQAFGAQKNEFRHLDYGGGNGALSKLLAQQGWDSTSFDPFPAGEKDIASLGKFNFITAFEVFEHVPDPNTLMQNLCQLREEVSLILFTTATSDGQLKKNSRITWWYCSPRNGHISIFSKKSLAALGARYGLGYVAINDITHCFVNARPAWARHVLG
jgi:SAM-dependent methyltransferase